jgi:hypothetical protein
MLFWNTPRISVALRMSIHAILELRLLRIKLIEFLFKDSVPTLQRRNTSPL